jgi:hypothetical protein
MAQKRCDYNPDELCTDCQLCQLTNDDDISES